MIEHWSCRACLAQAFPRSRSARAPAAQIRDAAPDGVDRIVDVAFATYADLYADVVAQGGVIASYFSTRPAPSVPFRPLLFLNTTIRLLGSDDFPRDAKRRAAEDLTTCLRERRLGVQIDRTLPLEQIATAHETVEQGGKARRVVITPNAALNADPI